MSSLNVGDKVPEFSLQDQNGNIHSNTDFAGKKVLIYFYPKASTPGCTIQSCSVRDALSDLAGYGVAALGVSPDNEKKQKKFDDKHSLGFPLLCDEEHTMAEAFGVWVQKSMFGKKYMGILRSAFLVDDGTLTGVWYKVSPKDTVPNVLKML